MLIPQVSLRTLLSVTAACGIVFFIARQAIRGSQWAAAIVSSVMAAVLLAFIFAGLFGAAYLLAKISASRRKPTHQSPFATDSLPPQIIPPRDAGIQ